MALPARSTGVWAQSPSRASGGRPEAEAHLALRPSRVWGAGRHSGRLDHALVGVEDVALKGQAEAHGLGGLRPLCLLRLGRLAPAGTAPLLEGGRQDPLGLGAQATCEAQRGSPSLHWVPDSAVTPPPDGARTPALAGPAPPATLHPPMLVRPPAPLAWGSARLPAHCQRPPCTHAPGAALRSLAVSSPAMNGPLPRALTLTIT